MSSNYHELRLEREFVEMTLREMGLDALLFPERATPGESRLSFMTRLEGECDILVYLVTQPSDVVVSEVARAEELGIPVVSLAKHSVDPATQARTATTHAVEQQQQGVAFQGSFFSLADLREQLRAGVASAISRRFTSASNAELLGNAAYYKVRSFVEQAQRHLAVVQGTSSLLLGPRIDRLSEETRLIDACHKRIEGILSRSDVDLTIIHVFDRALTIGDLETRGQEYPKAVEALDWMEDHLGEMTDSPWVHIFPHGPGLTSLMLSDSMLAFAVFAGSPLWFQQLDTGWAATLVWDQIANAVAHPHDLTRTLKDLRATIAT